MNRRQTLFALTALTAIGISAPAFADDALKAAVSGDHRTPAEKTRDAHRRPEQALAFWGLKPGMTVVEISPGSGYWTEILAPYAQATKGKYIATGAATPFEARMSKLGAPTFTGPFSLQSGPIVPAGSADMVLTARNIHNWMWQPGMLDKAMKDFHAALKTGGVLAVEEHRADPRPETVAGGRAASDGYVSTKTVIDAATKAGFRLAGQSEVNANPKDTKDHPGGVWMLPPNLRAPAPAAAAGYSADKYKAIGESDRMTLKFVKA